MTDDAPIDMRTLGDPELPAIQYLGDVQKLSLGPNDWLVLRYDEVLSREQMEQLRAALEAVLPAGKGRVLVLDRAAKVGVLEIQPPVA